MDNFQITDIYSGNIDREPEQDENRFRKESGFPSPARDHFEKPLSLDDYIIKRPAATFFMRVEGNGLNDIGIFSNDILVIDRSIKVRTDHIIVAILEGEMVVRQLVKQGQSTFLATDGQQENMRAITENTDFEIWGVVTHAIHQYV